MSADEAIEVQQAWEQFLVERGDSKGWNPRRVFEAGWNAARGES